MPRPLNYTTKIAARRTAQECLDLLADAGAHAVSVTYDERQPAGLAFRLDTAGGRRDFTLPVNAAATHAVLIKARRAGDFASLHATIARLDDLTTYAHARDVAWRVIRDWLEAQLALIAAEMATLDQVMLPYLQVAPGQTLFDRYVEASGRLEIGDGS